MREILQGGKKWTKIWLVGIDIYIVISPMMWHLLKIKLFPEMFMSPLKRKSTIDNILHLLCCWLRWICGPSSSTWSHWFGPNLQCLHSKHSHVKDNKSMRRSSNHELSMSLLPLREALYTFPYFWVSMEGHGMLQKPCTTYLKFWAFTFLLKPYWGPEN